ncbi:MAG TPA: FAD/NAD(P)-binding protein, partial [Thermoanaerobaculia bacterium]
MRTFDLAVIGGGVSATSVLQDLLPRLTRSARIAVIDRRGDFGGGVPYGSAARAGFLCNNPVHAQHDGSYAEWLDEHQERWLAPLAASGDPLLRRWYAHNAAALARHEYAELFLPRNVYGEFMREKMARLVAAAVEVIRGEVVDLAPGFTLKLADGELLSAHTVLLAPGGAPPICEAVDPSTLDPHQLADRSSIILLGSNATAMEMLWCIDGYAPHVREVTVISRSGRLPDAQRSGLPGVPPMQALDALHDSTAAALARAAEMDVTAALAAGYTSLDASAPLFASFTPRFDALSA